MNTPAQGASGQVLAGLPALLPDLEALYTDVHAHPELSMQETRTAGLAGDRLRAAGYEVTPNIGGTGVVGLLRNGDWPVVMLRADMDALPVEEMTGLPYASTVQARNREGKTVPVMHACGHDMHVAWLAGAAALLAQARDAWRGTVMAVFQPAEETAEGAQAMLADGLFDRFPRPDIVLGQHVMVGPAGDIGGRAGAITSAAGLRGLRVDYGRARVMTAHAEAVTMAGRWRRRHRSRCAPARLLSAGSITRRRAHPGGASQAHALAATPQLQETSVHLPTSRLCAAIAGAANQSCNAEMLEVIR